MSSKYKALFLNKKKYLLYFFAVAIFFIVYAIIFNQIKTQTKLKETNFNSFLKSEEFINIKEFIFKNIKSPYNEYNHIVGSNDNLEKILKKYNIDNTEINNLINEIIKKKLTNISLGEQIQIITKEEKGTKQIISLFYPIDIITSVKVMRNKDGFDISKIELKLNQKEIVLSNTIKKNLYSSAIEAGVEPNIIIEFANTFGFEVDFQRDINKGDRFEIYYEQFIDNNNVVRKTGKIIYASMFVNDKEISLYNFTHNDQTGFYDVSGKSAIKTLMKTPINGARLSSGFGLRSHPILGFNKLHQGTDFAAPTGTPIMASGDGVIVMAQRNKGYGNYILIRHNSTYETAYAHLSKFAKNIQSGVRVVQGQIIGYVGSTGLSTGPHLHYEIMQNKIKINSQQLKLPTEKVLGNEARSKFEVERIKIDIRLAELRKK